VRRFLPAALALWLAACASSSVVGGVPARDAVRAARSELPAVTRGFQQLFVFESAGQGMGPDGGVFVGADGRVFGTTELGGSNNCGTLFALTPAGTTYGETVLHSLQSTVDGCNAYAAPVEDATTGYIYVTTTNGLMGGSVVQLGPGSGGYNDVAVYPFEQATGYAPFGRVAETGSTIYVVAGFGGSQGFGSLIGLSSKTLELTHLYQFAGEPDGQNPDGSVVADAKGAIYGTTALGGSAGLGAIFKYSPRLGKESVVWSFTGGLADGSYPISDPLAIDENGAIYGTTVIGGAYGVGTVFKLTPSREGYKETILHSFGASYDGGDPRAGVTTSAIQYGA
jgi:uncharacterized repeat protein (TIGR03803 family)